MKKKINGKRHQIAETFTGSSKIAVSAHAQTKMLLTVAANATKFSTFEVQYGKSTSTRTAAIRHFRATLTDRVISRMRTY